MTAEQLEAARSERMRHNGHAATQYEDVRTWIEETGLCLFLPRSVQAAFTAPTFVEAVAGGRVTDPTLELVATAEELLVRLEAEGVAVRLSLNGQPGDQPDYVVAAWVLPYIYALRGDRDWRRPPQLTGSRQVSPLAVQVAKQLESGNQSAGQLRDALGREVTESAALRALHELWRQLRVIPVVPAPGKPALWQPLRQRFQKAIAEGASTSQVTAISVLASIYLQAVIAASMEDIELFLSALTARSKIREVVRGLAATRQVHTTTIGQMPLYYVAGTLPEFPVEPSFAISGSSYLNRYQRFTEERESAAAESLSLAAFANRQNAALQKARPQAAHPDHEGTQPESAAASTRNGYTPDNDPGGHRLAPHSSGSAASRPAVHSRSDARPNSRPSSRPGARPSSGSRPSAPRSSAARPAASRPTARPAAASNQPEKSEKSAGFARKPGQRSASQTSARPNARPSARPSARPGARPNSRPGTRSASAPARPASGAARSERTPRSEAPAHKSALKPAHKPARPAASSGVAKSADRNGPARPATRPASRTTARPVGRAAARPADHRGSRRPATEGSARASASKRYSLVGASSRRPARSAQPNSGKPAR